MNCETARKKVGALVDGELTKEEARILREHLEDCPECDRRVRERNRVARVLTEYEIGGPPDSLKSNIMDEIADVSDTADRKTTPGDGRQQSQSPRVSLTERLAPAAVFLFGILLGLTIQVWGFQSNVSNKTASTPGRARMFDVLTVHPSGSVTELLTPRNQRSTGGTP